MEDGFLAGARVAVVGLGLMGGSLAAALASRRACGHVVGVARNPRSLEMALGMRIIHSGTTDLAAGVAEADVVVLATPITDILHKVRTLGPLLKPGCILTDVGSTKRAITQAMEDLPPHVEPIGGHPMCGKETSGLSVADQALYRDKTYVLTPLPRTAPRTVATMERFVRAVGARPLLLDPERHDRLVAAISHLPYALAVALVNAADRMADGDALAWRLAASGFRDTSRVAAGDLAMMTDILATNRDHVLEGLRRAQEQIAALARCLEEGDAEGLETLLRAARDRRLEVYG
jgi:prephenate dehydrogenase